LYYKMDTCQILVTGKSMIDSTCLTGESRGGKICLLGIKSRIMLANYRNVRNGDDSMQNGLTESDIKKIKEEIEYRKLVVRKEALEAVKEARAQGDLSENFEYYAAKKDKNRNESRIRYLERMLKTAVVVTDDAKDDEVGLNKTVEIFFEEDDITETYRLVTSVRENTLKGLLSIESPLGKAMLGHKAGDRIYVRVNENYGYNAVIKAIVNKVDDGDDKIRSF